MYLDFHSAIILFPPGFISGIIGFNLSLFLEYPQLSFSVAKLSWQPITTNLVSGFSNNVNFHSTPCWIFGSSFRPLCWPPRVRTPVHSKPAPLKVMTLCEIEFSRWRIFPTTERAVPHMPVTPNYSQWALMSEAWTNPLCRLLYWCLRSEEDVSIFHQSM